MKSERRIGVENRWRAPALRLRQTISTLVSSSGGT